MKTNSKFKKIDSNKANQDRLRKRAIVSGVNLVAPATILLSYDTKFGKVNVKQTMRPNGQISIKIEHKDLTRVSLNTGISIEDIRQKLFIELSEFYELDDWFF